MIASNVNSANPFPGLRPFEAHETSLFFGRDGQSDELLHKLISRKLVAVVGTSGTGKSSLVRAGLLPALRSGISPKGSDWLVAIMRPGVEPMGNLARSLLKTSSMFDSDSGENIEPYPAICETILRRSSTGLLDAANWLKDLTKTRFKNLLVVVDQFEELFRFKREAADSQTSDLAALFVQLLLTATKRRDSHIYVVLTMRSDHLGDCSQFLGLPEAISDGQFLIPRMNRDERRAVIEGPIGVRQGHIDPLLVSRLLNEAGDNPEVLPVLQHALMRTWDEWKKSEDSAIGLQHYYLIGGMDNALSNHADEVYNDLTTQRSKDIARQIFSCLVDMDEKGREIRRPTSLYQICQIIKGTGENEGSEQKLTEVAKEVIPVLDQFRGPGVSFLTPYSNIPIGPDDLETVIDLAHESLISRWGKLHEWMTEEARSAGVYIRLAETAELYEIGRASLYKGRELRIAAAWKKIFRPSKAWAGRYHSNYDQAVAFLRESRKQKITNRAIGYSLIAVVAISGFLYARALRNRSLAEELAANSTGKAQSDPEGALSLAVQAVSTSPTEHALQALRSSLFAHSARVTIRPVQVGTDFFGATAAALTPNEKFVVTGNRDKKLRLWTWNIENAVPAIVGTLDPEVGFITDIAFDPEGDKIVISGQYSAVVWTFDQLAGKWGKLNFKMSGHGNAINRAAFSPDGRYIVTAGSDGTARIWSVVSESEKAVFIHHSYTSRPVWVKDAVFSPGYSMFVLTADSDGILRVWDWNELTGSQQPVSISHPNSSGTLNSAVFSPDGKYILATGNNGLSLMFDWDSRTGRIGVEHAILPHGQPVLDAAFDPNNSQNVITASADNSLRIWKVEEKNKNVVAPLEAGTANVELISSLFAYSDWATRVAYSKTGGYVLTSSYDGTVSIWRDIRKERKLEQYWDSYRLPVLALGFRRDGRLSTFSSDGSLRVWDVTNESQLEQSAGLLTETSERTDRPDERRVTSMALDSDRGCVAMGRADQTIEVSCLGRNPSYWGDKLVIPADCAMGAIAFGPDPDRILKACAFGNMRVYKLFEGSFVTEWRQTARITAVTCSANGEYVATGGTDGTIKISEIFDGHEIRRMKDYQSASPSAVVAIKFSRNGEYVATADANATICVWDVSTGALLARVVETSQDPRFAKSTQANILNINSTSSNLVNDIAFSPDGRFIAAARNDSRSVHIFAWHYFAADTSELLNKAVMLLK